MAFGALPFAGFLFCLFLPPEGLSEMGYFSWFLGFSILTRASQTFFQIPYLSFGAELTQDYQERSSIYSYAQLFGFAGNMLTVGLGYLYFFKSTELYKNGMLNETMYPWFGLFIAVLILLTSYATIIGTRHHIYIPPKKISNQPLSWRMYYADFLTIFKNQSYRVVFWGILVMTLVMGTYESLFTYINIHFWEFTPEDAATLFAAPYLLGIGVALVLSTKMVEWFDKKNTLIISIIATVVFTNLFIIAKLMGVMPPRESTLLIVLLSIGIFCINCFAPVVLITYNSMFADISDEIAFETEERKEGAIFALRALSSKAATGLGGFVAGLILDAIQFPDKAELGAVDSEVVYNLGLIGGPIVSSLALISIYFFAQYKLDRQKHRELMEQL